MQPAAIRTRKREHRRKPRDKGWRLLHRGKRTCIRTINVRIQATCRFVRARSGLVSCRVCAWTRLVEKVYLRFGPSKASFRQARWVAVGGKRHETRGVDVVDRLLEKKRDVSLSPALRCHYPSRWDTMENADTRMVIEIQRIVKPGLVNSDRRRCRLIKKRPRCSVSR